MAILAAVKLASCLTDWFPQWARFRGLFIAVFVAVAFMLTIGRQWLDATPHLRVLPKQGIAMAVIFLLAMIAGKLRIPRWSFAALWCPGDDNCVLPAGRERRSSREYIRTFTVVSLTPALIAGTLIGSIAARRGSRLQGDIASGHHRGLRRLPMD